MEKFKYKALRKITFLLLLITSIAYSQTKKTIVPKSGAIVFDKVDIIIDTLKNDKSFKKFISEMVDFQLENELLDRNLKIADSSFIIQMKEDMYSVFKEELLTEEALVTYANQYFKNNEIVHNKTYNNKIVDKQTIINPKEESFYVTQRDSITIISEKQPYFYNTIEIVSFQEYKQETKVIKGYTCFKVIMEYKSFIESEDDFDNFLLQNYIQKKELWVTTQIKCNYHPVVNEKEILSKYYPLEIIESSENIEGFITKYTVTSFTLK